MIACSTWSAAIESEELVRYATEAITVAIQVGNVEMVHIAHSWRLISFMERGDIGLAEAELDTLVPP